MTGTEYRGRIFGYYESQYSQVPDFDPGHRAECPLCRHPISKPANMIWFSIPNHPRTYFYRVHTECLEIYPEDELRATEIQLVSAVYFASYLN